MSTFVLSNDGGSAATRRIDYGRELNQEQLAVVLGGDAACLVLAGAGSGKTRTLTYRVAYLLEQGLAPESLLLLTFTNKAAKEMVARLGALLGNSVQGICAGTFHAIASRLLRSFAPSLGYGNNFSILDSDDAKDLLKAVIKDLGIDPKARRFPSPAVTQAIISYARNAQTRITEVVDSKHPNFTPLVAELEEAAKQYQVRKKAANVMDFDDLLSLLVRLLEDAQIGPMISSRFQYVLVDEYQDTNALQARIVHQFAGSHGNILVVGDDAQSIYAFRGADVRNILAFPEQWPAAKTFKLVTNYRSTPQILALANASLSHNKAQFEKELQAVRSSGDKPKLVACASTSQEAQYVAEQILQLRSQGTALPNIAVLFRSSAHSQALELELAKRDIPYEYRGGQKFFERAHIKDILAYLRLRANPHDEIAWLRVLGLQAGIGATTASQLAVQLKHSDDLAACLSSDIRPILPARAETGWTDFVAIAATMTGPELLPAGMIRGLMQSKYQDYLEREYPNWRERLEDIEQLALFAESYQDLPALIGDISLYDEVVAGRAEAVDADLDRLVLSTIHQAKGLEWDGVFIIHLADNAFPNRRALAEDGGLEEERRLFYVAVTRARRQLFLTYPVTMGYDALMFNQPSTFIEEVPPQLFDRVEIRLADQRHGRSSSFDQDDDWDSGDGWQEPIIIRDRNGEASAGSNSVWKKSPSDAGTHKPGSLLRNVDEL